MKTVLIFGAGASRAAASNPRTVAKTPPLDADFFRIAEAISAPRTRAVRDSLENVLGDYSATVLKSLETTTTHLYLKAVDSSAGSDSHIAFLSLLRLLGTVLAATTNRLKVGPRSLLYRFILNELKKLKAPTDLTVITFNYDLLIERTIEAIAEHGNPGAFAFPGCYRLADIEGTPSTTGQPEFPTLDSDHNGIPVLKLHGSLNWQSKHNSSSPRPSALFAAQRRLHVINSPNIQPALTWAPGGKRVYLKPIIVPPIAGKRALLHESMPRIWSLAAQALREANRIVIAGYSCPPLDLEARILLSENLRANPEKRVYVIDPSATTAARFVEICGVKHLTIYSTMSDWLSDASKYR